MCVPTPGPRSIPSHLTHLVLFRLVPSRARTGTTDWMGIPGSCAECSDFVGSPRSMGAVFLTATKASPSWHQENTVAEGQYLWPHQALNHRAHSSKNQRGALVIVTTQQGGDVGRGLHSLLWVLSVGGAAAGLTVCLQCSH